MQRRADRVGHITACKGVHAQQKTQRLEQAHQAAMKMPVTIPGAASAPATLATALQHAQRVQLSRQLTGSSGGGQRTDITVVQIPRALALLVSLARHNRHC
jgi:hypothetical protein